LTGVACSNWTEDRKLSTRNGLGKRKKGDEAAALAEKPWGRAHTLLSGSKKGSIENL